MTFTAFVFFDMFNALTSRSQHRVIALEVGFFSNKECTDCSQSVVNSISCQRGAKKQKQCHSRFFTCHNFF